MLRWEFQRRILLFVRIANAHNVTIRMDLLASSIAFRDTRNIQTVTGSSVPTSPRSEVATIDVEKDDRRRV